MVGDARQLCTLFGDDSRDPWGLWYVGEMMTSCCAAENCTQSLSPHFAPPGCTQHKPAPVPTQNSCTHAEQARACRPTKWYPCPLLHAVAKAAYLYRRKKPSTTHSHARPHHTLLPYPRPARFRPPPHPHPLPSHLPHSHASHRCNRLPGTFRRDR